MPLTKRTKSLTTLWFEPLTLSGTEKVWKSALGICAPFGDVALADKEQVALSWFDTPQRMLAQWGMHLRCEQSDQETLWFLEDNSWTVLSHIAQCRWVAPFQPDQPEQIPSAIARYLQTLMIEDPLEPLAHCRAERTICRIITAAGACIQIQRYKRWASGNKSLRIGSTATISVAAPSVKIARTICERAKKLKTLPTASTPDCQVTAWANATPLLAPKPVSIDAKMSTTGAVTTLFQEQVFQLSRVAQVVSLGAGENPVHDMRVACQRLRTLMKVFGFVFDPATREIDSNLRWVRQKLGAGRDYDVLLRNLVVFAPLFGRKRSKSLFLYINSQMQLRDKAYSAIVAMISTSRFAQCIEELSVTATQPAVEPERFGTTASKVVSLECGRLFRQGTKALRPPLHAESFHTLRKACKRIRYTLEWVEQASVRRYRPLLVHCTELQRTLGRHHDLCALHDNVTDWARRETSQAKEDAATARSFAASLKKPIRELEKSALIQWKRVVEDCGTTTNHAC